MKKPVLLDIGEVAEKAGLPPSTLRYYEEIGLLRPAGRRGLRRQFDPRVLEQLDFIALGRRAGFTLKEIAAMFAPGGRYRLDRAQLAARAEEIERSIRSLTAVRDGLRHAANCPAPSHHDCPTFQRLVKLAGREQGREARRLRRR